MRVKVGCRSIFTLGVGIYEQSHLRKFATRFLAGPGSAIHLRVLASGCLLGPSFAQSPGMQVPPTSALKQGWYAVQLGPPHYDPDPQKTNLWSMYQFCFGNARKYHTDKFHVSLAHLSADPTCVRVDGKAPKSIPRLPGCVSVQLTADCVAEPQEIAPEVDPQNLLLAWRKAFADRGVQVPADFMTYKDPQPNNILKYGIRVNQDYRILPSTE
jgi:hypothetical protein